MQFRKEGAYFDNIDEARKWFCNQKCLRCKLAAKNNGETIPCWSFCDKHKRKAAELMGFDVVEEKSEKTHIPDNIGSMTLAQAKEYCEKQVKGGFKCCESECELLRRGICCSDFVKYWNLNILTPQELEICRAVGAKYVCRDENSDMYVYFHKNKPKELYHKHYGFGTSIGSVICEKFPSVKPGDCIYVEDLIKEAANGT